MLLKSLTHGVICQYWEAHVEPVSDAITSAYLRNGVLGLTVVVLLLGLGLALRELKRVNEARLAETIAAANARIADQKEHLTDNQKFADLIRDLNQRATLQDETNKTRWDAIEKLQTGVLSLAQSVERVYSRQDQILANLNPRRSNSRAE